MVEVLFGDNQGGTYIDTFKTEEEARAFADMPLRKLTILNMDEVKDDE